MPDGEMRRPPQLWEQRLARTTSILGVGISSSGDATAILPPTPPPGSGGGVEPAPVLPPPGAFIKPSTPQLIGGLQGINVLWDGLNSASELWPYDTSWVEVHISSAGTGFTPGTATLKGRLARPGSLFVGGLTAGSAYYFKLRGADPAGNYTEASDAATGFTGLTTASDYGTATIGTGVVSFNARQIGGVTSSVGTATPSSPVVGDIWLDTTGGSTVHKRWSGTTWEVQQWGAGSIGTAAITEVAIDTAAITAAKLAGSAVTETKIASDAITAPKIAANAIEAVKIAAGAVTAEKIAASAVEADKIAANAVTAGKIAADAVTATTIAGSAITADKLAANSVTATSLAAGAVTAGAIAAGAVTTDKLTAGTITGFRINGGTISGGFISGGTVSAGYISGGTISGAVITSTTVSGYQVAGTYLTPTDVGSGGSTTIDGGRISTGTINAARIDTAILRATDVGSGGTTTIDGGRITSGTISGRVVQSSSGASRIVLNNADTLDFYSSNVKRGDLYGAVIDGVNGIGVTGAFDVSSAISAQTMKINGANVDFPGITTGSVTADAGFNGDRLRKKTSSQRYKYDIASLTGSMHPDVDVDRQVEVVTVNPAAILNLAVAEFSWLEGGLPTESRDLGFIAEDVAAKFPIAASLGPDGIPIAVRDTPILAALLAIVQQQQATITALTARIEALEA